MRRAAEIIVKGDKVGEVYRDQKSYDVAVWGDAGGAGRPARAARHADTDRRRSAGSARRCRRRSDRAGGQRDQAREWLPPHRRHHERRRLGDLGSVARDVEEKVKALQFKQGYYPEFLGEYAALQQSQRQLYFLGTLCFLGILLLIWLEFRSLRLTALLAVSLPFALLGGVVAVLLSGGTMSLGALVGFVTVLGISARNGIMLVSHYRHLETNEGEAFCPAMILRGAEERLAPILMTASCAALALLPLVLRGDLPGHEIEHPMALVILGGLVSSTALNLLLMPALYARFAHERRNVDSASTTATVG